MSNETGYEVVIGLEIHAQLATESKIFCSCAPTYGAEPNTKICPICLGMPGVLPVLNRKVVDYAMMAALATDCTILPHNRFARKNYFYPDLAKGYQITQYELPLCENGSLTVITPQGPKKIGITRIHIEEDPAKSIHDAATGSHETLLDFNRSGTPLIEIVSEPDIRTIDEAISYLTSIKQILEYLEISNCNLEQGNMRFDANISLRRFGTDKLGTKAEIKNMNSFHNTAKALEYEIARQTSVLDSGGTISQDTFLWDTAAGRTISMRTKEDAHDYRYFPEPDLAPLSIDDAWIHRIKEALPELPKARKQRFIDTLKLPVHNAEQMTADKAFADYFEACLTSCTNALRVSNWLMGSVMNILNDQNISITAFPLAPVAVGELLELIEKGTISGKIAKTVFEEMLAHGKPARTIVEEKGLLQISDDSALETEVDAVLQNNPAEVAAYKDGKVKLMGFFVGQIMQRTKGKANPQAVNKIIKEKLSV